MATVVELKAIWQTAQAAADKAYGTYLKASGQAALSWGGDGQVIGASYAARQAWKAADQLADLAFETYLSARDAVLGASSV